MSDLVDDEWAEEFAKSMRYNDVEQELEEATQRLQAAQSLVYYLTDKLQAMKKL